MSEMRPQRVLLVEDNRDSADAFGMLLEIQGHSVRIAYDGLAALELAAKYPPDVAFVDIGLPGIDGYEVARRMRQDPRLARCTLVALSGYGQEEDKERAREAGFDRHLTKPVEPQAVDAVLARMSRDARVEID